MWNSGMLEGDPKTGSSAGERGQGEGGWCGVSYRGLLRKTKKCFRGRSRGSTGESGSCDGWQAPPGSCCAMPVQSLAVNPCGRIPRHRARRSNNVVISPKRKTADLKPVRTSAPSGGWRSGPSVIPGRQRRKPAAALRVRRFGGSRPRASRRAAPTQ